MPNWCFNTLRIVGPSENIKDVLAHELSFQHYVPCAEDIEERYAEWGTKWEAKDFNVEYEGEFDCKVTFLTAWAPPFPFLEKLNALMPECWFKLGWEIELGLGSGIWIHSLTPKWRKPVKHVFQWEEPPCYPMENGKFLLPKGDESDDDETQPKPPTSSPVSSPRPEFIEAFHLPKKRIIPLRKAD